MRTAFKIPIVLVLLFLAAVALTLYLVTQTGLLHRVAERLLVTYVESRYDVNVTFGSIGGSIWHDVTIDDIRIDFELAPHKYRLARIKRLQAFYNLRELLSGRWQVDSLRLEGPSVVLRADTSGKLLLPSFGSGESPVKKRVLDIEVTNLRIVDGRFQWFRFPQPLLVDSINLGADLQLTSDTVKANLATLSFYYPSEDLTLKQLAADVVVNPQAVQGDSIVIETDESRLNFTARYPLAADSQFSAQFENSHLSLDELSRVLKAKVTGQFDFSAGISGTPQKIGGHAQLNGDLFERHLGPLSTDFVYGDGIVALTNLSGRAFDGTVNGKARLDLVARPETFTATLNVKKLNFDRILPNSFPSSLNGQVKLRGSGMGENSFSLDLQLALGPGNFDWVRFDSLSGPMTLNVENLYLGRGFHLDYKHSRFFATGMVDYENEMYLMGSFKTSQLADFWGDLFVEELSGGAYAEFVVSGPLDDPDISGTFKGDSCSFYGLTTDSLEADYDIESFLYSQRGDVNLHAWASDIWGLPADSLAAALTLDSNLITVSHAQTYDAHGGMQAAAQVTTHDSTASVVVSDYAWDFDSIRFVNTTPFDVEFLADGIQVDSAVLQGSGGEVQLGFKYGYDSTINLNVSVDTLPLAPWLTLFEVDSLVSGRLNAEGTLTGRLDKPKIDLNARLTNMRASDLIVGELDAQLSYDNDLLLIDEAKLQGGGNTSTLSGFLPMHLRLDTLEVDFPEENMEFQLESEGNDLTLASLALPDLEALTGQYTLTLDVQGTLDSLKSQGSFQLDSGYVKVYEIENPITNLSVNAYSQDRKIYVDWAEGTMSYGKRSGQIYSTGEITLLDNGLLDYDLQVRGDKLPIKYDLGDIYVYCDIELLEITGSDPPRVDGDVTVREATYYDEFEQEFVMEAKQAADTAAVVDYTINVDFLPASIRVRNSVLNAVLDGKLTVIREGVEDNYIGTLNVVRGKFYLRGFTFDIQEGSTIIFDNIEQPNPTLNVHVSTKVRNYASGGYGGGQSQIDLVIGGTLLQPSLAIAEGSNMSLEDALSLLVLSNPASVATQDINSTQFEQRLWGYTSQIAGQALTRKIGVESIEIIPSYGSNQQIEGAELSVGLYATSSLYTYLTSPLGFEQGTEVGFEYRFGRHFYLGGLRDRDNLYHLNINLNWVFK